MTNSKNYSDLDTVKTTVAKKTNADADAGLDLDLDDSDLHMRAMDTLERKGIEENLRNQVASRQMRFDYSRWVFRYLVGYSVFVGITVVLSGYKIYGFELPDVVLGALVGSTAVSAIGLVLAVTTGLFNKRD